MEKGMLFGMEKESVEPIKVRIATRAILFNDCNEVLIAKRMRGAGAGKWSLVGGKPDDDETLEQAVLREVQEELGVTFTPVLFEKAERHHAPDDKPGEYWDTSFYSGRIEGELHIKPDEHSEVAFVTKETLKDYDIAFGHEKVLQRFFDRFGSNGVI